MTTLDTQTQTTAQAGVNGTTVGTHVVDRFSTANGDNRVVIRDVEVFSEVEDGPMGNVDAARVNEIAEATNARMATGMHPLIIVSHEDSPSMAPVVGRVPRPVRVGTMPQSGKAGIFADVEMPLADFEALVASNKLPRRSAEIATDTLEILQVALLGREPPAATLPDTHFGSPQRLALMGSDKPLAKIEFEDKPRASVAQYQQGGTMTPAEALKAIQSILADMDTGEGEQDEAVDNTDGATLTGNGPPQSEDEAEDNSATVARNSADTETEKLSSTPESAKYAAQVRQLTSKMQAMQGALDQATAKQEEMRVRAKYSAEVVGLRDFEGFVTVDPDNLLAELTKFESDEKRAEHLDWVRSNFRQEATGQSLVAAGTGFHQHTSTGKQDQTAHAANVAKVEKHATQTGKTFDAAAAELGLELNSK